MTQSLPPAGSPALPSGRTSAASTTSPLLVLVAWLVVGLPAAWGVEQTVIKSLALFRNSSSAAPATAPATAPAPTAK